ncbi:MAG: hypothetical protein JOZ55_03285 [Alphaproteobacteria bacterium]|nr:hypothetical protein [Alphaproteobacteria bacterium]
MFRITIIAPCLALGAFLAIPAGALADASSETVTARTHADLASKAADLAGVRMHLHHAINCLTGPAGKGFDARELNPCANAGNGAIADAHDGGQRKRLESAMAKAEQGLTEESLPAAQKDAAETSSLLKAP